MAKSMMARMKGDMVGSPFRFTTCTNINNIKIYVTYYYSIATINTQRIFSKFFIYMTKNGVLSGVPFLLGHLPCRGSLGVSIAFAPIFLRRDSHELLEASVEAACGGITAFGGNAEYVFIGIVQ